MISLFLSSDDTRDPISNFWYGPIGRTSAAGVDVTPDIALTYSAVWACTRLLAASGSCLPLNLMQRVGNGSRIASEHRVHRLIHSLPNVEQTSMVFRSLAIAQQVNKGDFFAEIARDKLRNPVALWPIDRDRVKPLRADADQAQAHGIEPGGLIWQVANQHREPSYIPDRDMLHVRSIIGDGICGKGVIENARETIGHGLATVQQGAAYMKNSARPSVVIKGAKFKTPEDREYYRTTWNAVHGGPENNAKPALLPEGADITVLSFSPEDSQFIQTLQHSIEEIARWYGIPPHMIQHLLRSTYSNIEHQGIDFVVYSLVPWLKLWEEEIWLKLLTDSEKDTYYAKHNVEGLLRGDSQSRSQFYQSMWQLGAYSINEIREKEDMNPIGPEGDQHFVQTSYSTLGKLSMGLAEWERARTKNDVTRDEYRKYILNLDPMEDKDDAPLLSLVGGLTGSMEIARAVGRGEMTPESASDLLQLFLRIEEARATKIAGEKVEQPQEQKDDAVPVMPARDEAPTEDDTLSRREAAIRQASQLMLDEAFARMLNRESTALFRAASKEPGEFFKWLDDFYGEHELLMADALRRPLNACLTASGEFADIESLAAAMARDHVAASREQVLLATEVKADEWSQLPERVKRLSELWKTKRTAQYEVKHAIS